MAGSVKVGDKAPEIDLLDGEGQRWQLSAQQGRPVVLLFYPGDDTPVCTKQLCSVRNNWGRYQALNAEVVGINTDSAEAHQGFASSHRLPLRLLVDGQGTVVNAYGMKGLLGVKRGVVIVDKAGTVRYVKTVLPIFMPSDDEILEAVSALG